MKPSDIKKQIDEATNNPSELGRIHLELSHYYGLASQNYHDLIPEMANEKRRLLDTESSVTKAEKLYEISEIGQIERKIKITLKWIEKYMSSIKRRIETMDNESRNQY